MKPEYKTAVSALFVQNMQKGMDSLPAYAKFFLQQKEFSIVAGRMLPDLHPGLANIKCPAFHAPTVRTLFFGEVYFCGYSQAWLPSEDPAANLFHEVGHFLDLFVLGNGEFPDGYFSNTSAFIQAFDRDTSALRDSNFSAFKEIFNGRDWDIELLRTHFENVFMNDPAEVLAELWAHENGHPSGMPWGLMAIMPGCAEIVRHLHREVLPGIAGPQVEICRPVDLPGLQLSL